MSAPTLLPLITPQASEERERLVRRAKLLAWWGVGWHAIEATVAIGAGVVAGSIALVGFGADSLVESVAGFVLLWRFAASRAASHDAERTAQKVIAVSFYVIAAYVAVEAARSLLGGEHPEVSYVGIGLSAVTLLTMPPLAIAKARVGERLGSSATKSDGRQNMLCAYLSVALLVGLGANAVVGWWWADPIVALIIATVAVREGRNAWRGEACCTSPDCGAQLTRAAGPGRDGVLRGPRLVDAEVELPLDRLEEAGVRGRHERGVEAGPEL